MILFLNASFPSPTHPCVWLLVQHLELLLVMDAIYLTSLVGSASSLRWQWNYFFDFCLLITCLFCADLEVLRTGTRICSQFRKIFESTWKSKCLSMWNDRHDSAVHTLLWIKKVSPWKRAKERALIYIIVEVKWSNFLLAPIQKFGFDRYLKA